MGDVEDCVKKTNSLRKNSQMKFEDLDAWKEARVLVREIYEVSKDGPLSKDFGLRDQIRRAAVSVMSNLAEGFERFGKAEKRQFYNVARASSGEVRSLTYVLLDAGSIREDEFKSLQDKTIRVGKLVTGLHKTVE